ncbi:MAG: MCE family protein, partial [Mycobacterium sp.]
DNLPKVAAKGGPGGKPGCGSLPDPSKNFPIRQLITDTGFGTGLDIRPNPGIGHPCWADWFPVTRAVPEKPSIRQCLPGPAPGPDMGPGMPPYGAAWYGPGGVPLWPGVPPAPGAAPAAAPPPPPPAPAP